MKAKEAQQQQIADYRQQQQQHSIDRSISSTREEMGRKPCCEKVGLKKGAWTAEEDRKLIDFMLSHGQSCWRVVPKLAGLLRCGKSCRLRWTNYLRPDLRRGLLSVAEEKLVIDLHSQLGNRWSKIASRLPGRTDNEIKNLWNTHIKKKLKRMGIDPITHRPMADGRAAAAAPPSPPHPGRRREAEEEEEEEEEEKDSNDSGGVAGCPEFCTDEVPIMEPDEMLLVPCAPSSSSFSSSTCSTPPWVEAAESSPAASDAWGLEDLIPLWDSIDAVELWEL